jgi:hypothetical protein
MMIANSPSTRTQRNLEEGVAIQKHLNCNEEAEWKGVMRLGLMRFIEGVRFRVFSLVVSELLLLFHCENA